MNASSAVFACPICAEALTCDERGAWCESNHRFDRAREGYLHLLPSGRKVSTKLKGDTSDALKARREFLDAGHYVPISDAVNAVVSTMRNGGPSDGPLLDVGCGEGYYLQRMGGAARYGIDIAKDAVRMAARRDTTAEFAVASTYRLPVLSGSVATVVSVFAPRPYEEFRRVVRPGGAIITASPGPEHLRELTGGIDAAGEDRAARRQRRADDRAAPPLGTADAVRVLETLELTEGDLRRLVEMTPLAWQAHVRGRRFDTRRVTIDVWVERSSS